MCQVQRSIGQADMADNNKYRGACKFFAQRNTKIRVNTYRYAPATYRVCGVVSNSGWLEPYGTKVYDT